MGGGPNIAMKKIALVCGLIVWGSGVAQLGGGRKKNKEIKERK